MYRGGEKTIVTGKSTSFERVTLNVNRHPAAQPGGGGGQINGDSSVSTALEGSRGKQGVYSTHGSAYEETNETKVGQRGVHGGRRWEEATHTRTHIFPP